MSSGPSFSSCSWKFSFEITSRSWVSTVNTPLHEGRQVISIININLQIQSPRLPKNIKKHQSYQHQNKNTHLGHKKNYCLYPTRINGNCSLFFTQEPHDTRIGDSSIWNPLVGFQRSARNKSLEPADFVPMKTSSSLWKKQMMFLFWLKLKETFSHFHKHLRFVPLRHCWKIKSKIAAIEPSNMHRRDVTIQWLK